MATIEFKKEDFTENNSDEFLIEFHTDQIGLGSNLIVETKNAAGDYEVVQVPIRRDDDCVVIVFAEAVDGRLIFEK